jgi:hypothetical protein
MLDVCSALKKVSSNVDGNLTPFLQVFTTK